MVLSRAFSAGQTLEGIAAATCGSRHLVSSYFVGFKLNFFSLLASS